VRLPPAQVAMLVMIGRPRGLFVHSSEPLGL